MTVKHANSITKFLLFSALALPAALPTRASAAENPMDWVGVAHNLYLECLALSKDQTISPLRRIVDECGYDPGMPTDELVAKYQALIEIKPGVSMRDRMAEYRDSYDDYEFSFFVRVDEIFAVARNTEEADAALAKLEAEAVAKLRVEDPAGRAVLSMLSTSRHSLRYWSAHAGIQGQVSAARWPKWIRVLIVVVADGAGTAIGGLPGGAGASTMAGAILKELDPP
jgi:hypothetical protein